MCWSLRDGLRDSLVAAAPYGGPIALLREPLRRSPSSRPQLEIYSASGVGIASFPWKSGPVVHLGWTVSDELLCIQEDGSVLIYDLFGSFKRHFSMGQEVVQSQVLEAKVFHSPYGTGVAIVTGSSRFTLATNIDDLKLRRLPEVPGSLASCWGSFGVCSGSLRSCQGSPGLNSRFLLSLAQVPLLFSRFPIEDPCVLIGELDGVRIISSTNQELLQEVPLVCQDIFKIASMAPGALLLEAHREYEVTCLLACAWRVSKCLVLQAASFGKCFLTDFSPDQFVSTCRELRVLNAVRESSVGLPLTHAQFKQMTLQVLIDRLVYRQFYPLAIEICRYLKIPDYQGVSRVLKHWASCKVQQKDLSDEAIARAVCVKVGDSPGVSYSDIAAKAYECGRTELAIKLLDFEARSGEQVPLLLKMKRSQLALSKAVESGDTDLVYTVVNYLKNEMNRGDFFMTLRNQPVALSLYRQATMEALLALGLHKQAEQLYRDFRVPDKRYWWLKLKSLAEKEEWEELEKFSKSKKSPIGYLAFVEVCIKCNNKYEAKKYVSKVTPEQKVKAHLAVSDLEGAADAAIERRNEAEMGAVLSRCSASDRLVIDRLNRARAGAAKK
uniref:Vacuolar protein sorting-associated protein 16 homolog n=1 Tax=Acanthochromis polyacanthus TaxID=80966 RepID=A0A3Q1I310_9TELE